MPEVQPGVYNKKNHDKGFKKGPKKFWPAWVYSVDFHPTNSLRPDGSPNPLHAKIVQTEDDVPPGWAKDPKDAYDPNEEAPEPKKAAAPAPLAPKGRGRKKEEEAPIPQRTLDEQALINAGYDPAEIAKATDAEIAAEIAKITKKK